VAKLFITLPMYIEVAAHGGNLDYMWIVPLHLRERAWRFMKASRKSGRSMHEVVVLIYRIFYLKHATRPITGRGDNTDA
jgi:hypothetical protein